jgi:transposase-like protein
MHRRKWDSPTKAKMVIQGLQGKPIAEICHEHQISQSQYDQWCDQFLAHAANAFEVNQQNRTAARLARENTRLKPLGGELTLE